MKVMTLYDDYARKKISGKEFLETLNRLSAEKKINVWISQSQRVTTIHIDIDPILRPVLGWGFQLSLEDLEDAISEFYDHRCYVCGLTENESLDKFDRGLEIHHMRPVSVRSLIRGTKITECFAPVCFQHHIRGRQ